MNSIGLLRDESGPLIPPGDLEKVICDHFKMLLGGPLNPLLAFDLTGKVGTILASQLANLDDNITTTLKVISLILTIYENLTVL